MTNTRRRTMAALLSVLGLGASTLAVIAPTAQAQTFSGIAGHAAPGTAGFDANPDPNATPVFTEKTLAQGGDGVFDCYRIPALTVTPSGTVLASWDGRPSNCADSPNPNSIVQRTSTNNGEDWGPQTIVAQGVAGADKVGFSDPSYVVDYQTGAVFNFHVKSFDKGLWQSQPGTDPNARNIMHAAYAKSTDDGTSYVPDNVITGQITPDPSWRSRFATSGNGIQLQYGPWKGRLVQPSAVVTTGNQVVSVAWLSDDHGKTWYASQPWGTAMDENKIVELSDGTLMNNSRSSNPAETYRKVSYSYDGGRTWTEPVQDRNLPDPRNNASIIRAFPNAPKDSALAKVLLFSNTANTAGRLNGTIRMSCDDGKTWPVAKEFRPTDIQYTHMAVLSNGNIGLLYEGHNRGNHNNIYFSQFNLSYLGASCIGTSTQAVVSPGNETTVDITVTNTLAEDIVDAPVTITAPEDWRIGQIPNLTLAQGQTTTVSVPVTVPETAVNGSATLTLAVPNGQIDAVGKVTVRVAGGSDTAPEPAWPESPSIVASLRNPKAEYRAGDRIEYNFEVINPLAVPISIVPTGELEGFDPNRGAPNCRWRTFNAKHRASCTTAYHTVTAEDIAAGTFTASTQWLITWAGGGESTLSITTPQVRLTDQPEAPQPEPEEPTVLSATVDPIGVIASTGEQLDVPVTVRVTSSEDSLPAGAQVKLYLDGVYQETVSVIDGAAATTLTVDPVGIGEQPRTHKIVARPVSTDADRVIDGRTTFQVSPADRLVGETQLILSEFSATPVGSVADNRVVVSARLLRDGQPTPGVTLRFSTGDNEADAVTNSQGVALAYLTVPQLGEDITEPTDVEIKVVVESSSTATTDYTFQEASGTLTIMPKETTPDPAPQPGNPGFLMQLFAGLNSLFQAVINGLASLFGGSS